MHWLDRLDLPQQPARLGDFKHDFGGDALRRETRRLQDALAGAEVDWRGDALITSVSAARDRYRHRLAAEGAAPDIPPLNPARPAP